MLPGLLSNNVDIKIQKPIIRNIQNMLSSFIQGQFTAIYFTNLYHYKINIVPGKVSRL
jgi:hypothetical protein